MKMSKNRTTEDFINIAKSIHGDKYDYSKVKYTNQREKVQLTCSIHGEFEIEPRYHTLDGRGCKKCKIESNREIQCRIFIKKAAKFHNNKYDYSLVEYIDNKKRVKIICPTHGIFEQTPDGHNVSGCLKCGQQKKAINQTSNTEEFIKKSKNIHRDKYNYSKVKYKQSNIKVQIICPKHGEFKQTPNGHINGRGCLKCGFELLSRSKIKNKEYFINKSKKIHEDKYNYSTAVYKGAKTKLNIICKKHGEFLQTPNNHTNGKGCPNCKRSLGEEILAKKLTSKNIVFENEKTFDGCINKNKLRFDFYIPQQNLCIEYNGIQHYNFIDFFGQKSFDSTQINDKIKKEFCKENNIELLIIKYDQNIDDILTKRFN